MEATKTHVQNNIWANLYVSKWGVLFWPQNGYFKGKKGHLIFRHTQTRKKHVLQQWQWIVFGSAKPAQDEKQTTRKKWNQQMQKQQHKIIKKCENNCPKPNVSAESFMKLRGVHVNSRVLIAHGCSCVFFIFFRLPPIWLTQWVSVPKKKNQSNFWWGSRAIFGYKMAAPRRANPTKKTSLDTCWFGWWFCLMRCYLAAKPVSWWPDGSPWVLGQLGLDCFFKDKFGAREPQIIGKPWLWRAFFEINLNVGQ